MEIVLAYCGFYNHALLWYVLDQSSSDCEGVIEVVFQEHGLVTTYPGQTSYFVR